MATYQLTGSVINTTTRQGIPALHIEAWGKPDKASKKLATATTAAEGHFVIQFDLQASEQNPDPQGFIKVFSGTTLLQTTAEQPIKLWTAEAKPLTIEVDQTSDDMLQLLFTLGFSNGQPGVGVQLVFSYALPSGETWTSQPLIADAEGKLSFGVPIGIGTVIDWSRAGYAFSKAGKPLTIAETGAPQQTPAGLSLAITLAPAQLPWPPEQDPNKWYVRGKVMTATGDAVSALVSASAISLSGETNLGQVQTEPSGRYEIIYEWTDKCPPDIQVIATVEDQPIAQSAIFFAVGKSVRIDLISGNEPYIGSTEFERVEDRVLKCNDDFNIAAIGAKQFDYLLGKTRLASDKLSFYLVARKLQTLCEVPAAVFYGLFRAKLPATLQGLVLQTPKVLQNALNKAIQQNIIDRKYQNQFDALLAALRQMAVAGAVSQTQALDHAGVGEVLTIAELPASAQQPLLNLYLQHQGDDALFWEALGKDNQLAPYANKVKTTLQTGALASYHLPTMQAFKAKLGAEGAIRDLAQWQDNDWQAFAQSLQSVPDGIPGDALPDRIRFYVENMSRTVKRAFAREYTTANVLRSATFADPLLHEFLNTVPDFDYGNSAIPAILDKTPFTGDSRQVLEKTLKSMQRLYRLAPIEQKFPVLETLYAGGLTASRDIVLQGSAQFIDLYAVGLGGVDIAVYVYDKAATVTAVATNVLTGYSDLFNASGVYAIGGGVPISLPDAEGDLAIPSYQDLFGSQSFCECLHCSSVYSPAAYFVDLLEYLRQSPVTKKIGGSVYVKVVKNGVSINKTGLDVLFERRADLGDIRLDCKNTNTVLSYIDLANEIFERTVAGETDSSLYQTNWTELELKSNPEYVLNSAYDTLAETVYPLSLPFRLWNVEAEHYLNHLGIPRWQLMQTLVELPAAGNSEFQQINFAYLGLTGMDVQILTGAPEYSGDLEAVRQMWGYDVEGWRPLLIKVPEFLQRSGLTYSELLQLLQVPYLQDDGIFGIDFSDAETACDIDGAVLRYSSIDGFDPRLLSKDTFDRIQRFLRLRRKTGWSIWELGRVLAALPQPQITEDTLLQVCVIKRLADSLALEVLEVISWWADMDTALDDNDPDYRSWYETVFLNSAVLNPPDQALLLDQLGTGALISEHFSSIAAALQVTEADAGLLAESLLVSGVKDDALTLNNLSQMYRIASLCRALDIDISQYFLMARLIEASPWTAAEPQAAMQFVDAVQFQQRSAFSSAELGYLLLHDAASVASVQMSALAIADLLSAIQIAVRAVWARYLLSSTPLIEQLQARLGDYFEQQTIDVLVTMVGQDAPYSAEDQSYLLATLYFLAPVELNNAIEPTLSADVRYQNLLSLLNRYGRISASINVAAQIVADAFAMDLSVAQQLLTEVVLREGHPGEFAINALLDPLFIDSGKEKLAAVVTADVMQEAFNIVEGTSAMTVTDIEDFIELHFTFLNLEEAKTKLTGASALTDVLERYRYLTATLDAAQYLLSDAVFAEQFAALRSIQKSALVVNKFQITETELPILAEYAATLQVLPVSDYPFLEQAQNFIGFSAWQSLAKLVALRRVFVATDSQLFVQLEKLLKPNLIDTVSPNDEVSALIDSGLWQETDRGMLVWRYELANAAGWSFSEIMYVAGPELLAASLLSDMLNVAALVYITDVIALAVRLGTTAAQLNAWAAPDLSQTDAANAKQTARARYTLEQWYGIAPTLRDVLREQQRDALTAYMLNLGGFATTVELYNYYLIDSEMSACMLTSRLKLALSSVQLFLQRCLLNLEDEFVAVTAAEEWEWRKNYRVWEANRKVFLYPENYIKPELRITRSEIFDAAQSVLLQNEVTEDVAEQALLRYLEQLDDVSNLEVSASYHETGLADDDITVIDRLHVVARSRGIPHKYYYRVRDSLSWAPWQEVDADIGADQLMPVVINSRLYLFWPMFFEKQIAGTEVLDAVTINSLVTENAYESYLNYLLYWTNDSGYYVASEFDTLEEQAEALSDLFDITFTEADVINQLVSQGAQTWSEYSSEEVGNFSETIVYFEIKLSVSEYKNGNWLPSRTSASYILSDQYASAVALLEKTLPPATVGDFHFYTQTKGDTVTIECVQSLRYTDGTTYHFDEGRFEYDVLSKEILAFESKADIDLLDVLGAIFGIPINIRAITAPSGTDVIDNAFTESSQSILEIPVTEASKTNFVALLESTPGTFRVPIQHQYEQFSANDAFFFGDDKRSFIVALVKASLVAQFHPLETDSPLLNGYLNSDSPGIGVYDVLLDNFSGISGAVIKGSNTFRASEHSLRAKATPDSESAALTASSTSIVGLQQTTVFEFYPLLEDVYRFDAFYHPLVGELIKKVNGDGTTAALSRSTQSIIEKFFISTYQPTANVAEDYPLRHFSFSDLDANGFYNYEFFFHVPLLIAVRLSKNQQFADAQRWFHTIFDPTSRSGDNGAQRFWQFKPFFDMYDNTAGHPFDSIYDLLTALAADPNTADSATLALKSQTEQQIAVWRANPFDPHAIAALRPVAYMKTVVMEYLNNLIAWGDYLFEQFTIEAINEATLYYMLAYQILGDRPVALPELKVVAQSYNQLGTLDAFSNAVAALENLINLPEAAPSGASLPPPLYFCIPNNPTLLQYWDTVADRLFKIRHCMTIEGVVQQLLLFEPPIDPALLVAARAGGVSISSALASLATPAPHYRFVYLMQKAVEYCQVVKGLGSQLLAAYEKQDAETLGLLRAEHEESLLKASTELRNLQVDEARENLAALEKSKVLVEERIAYYSNIKNRSENENAATDKTNKAEKMRKFSSLSDMAASVANFVVPNFSNGIYPPSSSVSYGGSNLGAGISAISEAFRGKSAAHVHEASNLSTTAGYDRRWDDWKLQERLAKKELTQIEKQIIAAQIRLALAEKERDNHAIQLAQSREVRDFLSSKFSNQELYGWMISQTSAIYFQSYKLAYDLAKRCEKAYQRESGEYSGSYIAYGYFDSMKKGLLSGERLHHDLQRMEFDFLNNNRREYELSKHVSLVQLNPSALIALRETGACFISLPETLFDFDYPGHYFRRIKSVSLTIPSLTGPYTSLSSTLTLQSDKVRIVAKKDDGDTDINNLQFNLAAVKSIATSSGQSDSGVFQLDFRDERYLPFEGAGVISEWKLQLNNPQLAQFDYDSISDVILHINYTARDGGEVFRAGVESALLQLIDDYFGSGQALQQLISIKQNQSADWARLSNLSGDAAFRLAVDLGLDNFPYYLRNRGISISSVKLALGSDSDVGGWDAVEIPEFTVSAGFVEDNELGLPAAEFEFDLQVETETKLIQVTLPKQLIALIDSEVQDLYVISTYKIGSA
jgi:hypothetical protein